MKIFIVLSALFITSIFVSYSQEVLNTTYPGSQSFEVVAPESIRLAPSPTPGFSYSPSGSNNFHGYIDPYLVELPTGGEIGVPPGSSNQFDGVVGSTQVNFSVNENGNAVIQIPITVCPGIAGVQPSLSLVYNSSGPESYLSEGWGLSGISAITKIPKTIEFDGRSSAVVNSDNYDAIALDGSRLFYDPAKDEYKTEFESFSRIKKLNDENGQIYYKVWTKDGSIMEFGKTPDSKQHLIDINGLESPVTMSWYVSKVQDVHGNAINYSYFNNQGIIYPLEINYGNGKK